jgi:hypothetical protein
VTAGDEPPAGAVRQRIDVAQAGDLALAAEPLMPCGHVAQGLSGCTVQFNPNLPELVVRPAECRLSARNAGADGLRSADQAAPARPVIGDGVIAEASDDTVDIALVETHAIIFEHFSDEFPFEKCAQSIVHGNIQCKMERRDDATQILRPYADKNRRINRSRRTFTFP